MSNFSFVDDTVLRSNLDLAFAHIVDLLALSESDQYKGKKVLVSSLRKTIIIHTASIVEALLLWKLRRFCKAGKIEMTNEWKYFDIVTIHKIISDSSEIVAGFRKKEEKDIKRIDFNRITDLCRKYDVIKSDSLEKEIDKVREFRNKLHIGGLAEIEKEYRRNDLEFCFKVARKVKDLVSD